MSYYLVHVTYPILFVAVLASQLCIPVPAMLFLLSAGALAGSGKLSYSAILGVAVVGSLLGDLVWFEAGRKGGKRVLRLLCALATDPSYCIRRGRAAFEKRGVRLLLIAKFIPGLDGISPPLAGVLGTPRSTFLLFDTGGAILWAGAYVSGGYFFAEELNQTVKQISTVANALILILGVPLFLFFIWKLTELVRISRLLRPLQISAQELKDRLDSKQKFGVLDLLRFEEDPAGVAGIPGAVRLDPSEIRRKKRIVVPEDVTVVVYCRCQNSFVSARVAAAMRKHGIKRVRVLIGGLDEWIARGFPVTNNFSEPLAELIRLGIELSPPWESTHPS